MLGIQSQLQLFVSKLQLVRVGLHTLLDAAAVGVSAR